MHNYGILIRYVARQRRSFVVIFVLSVAASLLTVCQPWPMKLVVDQVLNSLPLPSVVGGGFKELGLKPTVWGLLVLATAGGLLLFVLNSLVEVMVITRWTVAGRRMVYDLAEDLFARLQRRSLQFHTRTSVGEVLSRITGDCWCVYRIADTLLIAPFQALLTLALAVVLMAPLDPTLTWLVLAFAPLMVGASWLIGQPLQAAARVRREAEARIQAHLQQTLTGIPVVQAFVQEDRERARFEQYAGEAIRAQQRSTLLGSLNSLSAGLVTTLGTGAVLWLGARHVLEGRLSVGGLLVFLVYLTSLQTQMKTFAGVYSALRGFQASVDRVRDVLVAGPDLPETSGAIALPAARGHVQFEQVVFGYEPKVPVLRGVSLEVKPGQTLALVGATGTGKTTLVNLIPRFFDPWQGRVLIDGHDVRELALRQLRQQVAIVWQDPFLLPLSVADNIAYGRPQAACAEIEVAARAACAHAFIERLPQGYETVLGERGATLSGGERQRLAIARAYLKNAPLLILDEPTSALDPETEHQLMEALERLRAGRTTVLIAHRLSTVRGADRIVVLHDGQIAESGTHAELMAGGRLYAGWWERQSETKIL
jgi:ATP-binding cassette, subfamily B, bacterial